MGMSMTPNRFADWLSATMQSRGLSQAELARAVGVADTQVSRWRRGQVVPTVHYLQRIADSLGVPRTSLDRLAGYPVELLPDETAGASPDDSDVQSQAELEAHLARFRQTLEGQVPRHLWRAFTEACDALAGSLRESFAAARIQLDAPTPDGEGGSGEGAQPRTTDESGSTLRGEQPGSPEPPARRTGIGFRP